MLNRAMGHYEPLRYDPQWLTMTYNIHTMTHYNSKLSKFFRKFLFS